MHSFLEGKLARVLSETTLKIHRAIVVPKIMSTKEESRQMNKAKKAILFALVSSQIFTPLSAAAAMTTQTSDIMNRQFSEDHVVSETAPSEEPTEELPAPDEEPEGGTPEESDTEPVPEPSSPEPDPEEEQPEAVPEPTPTPETKPIPKPEPSQPTEPDSKGQRPPIAPEKIEEPVMPDTTPQTTKEKTNRIVIQPTKEVWAFIKEIGEDARRVGLENDLYASVMIAQAILESASGQSQLSQAPYHNLFGIKGTVEGKGVTFKTQEDDGTGNLYTIDATFRQYEDYEASFKDYASLLKDGLTYDSDFYKGTWKSKTDSYEDATEFLTGRYATDTQYGEKLNALIETYALTSYDYEQGELPAGNEELLSPVRNPVISSVFGPRGDGFHRGIDFAASLGTPIMASLSGTVIRAEYHESWGNYVAIEHENGLTTLYAHNHGNLVTVGQNVTQGEVIASMGSTGNSTGPHLHFEVSLSPSLAQNQLIDPMTVLPSR